MSNGFPKHLIIILKNESRIDTRFFCREIPGRMLRGKEDTNALTEAQRSQRGPLTSPGCNSQFESHLRNKWPTVLPRKVTHTACCLFSCEWFSELTHSKSQTELLATSLETSCAGWTPRKSTRRQGSKVGGKTVNETSALPFLCQQGRARIAGDVSGLFISSRCGKTSSSPHCIS